MAGTVSPRASFLKIWASTRVPLGLCSASSVADCQGSGPADSGLPAIVVGGFSQLGASSGVPRTRVDSNSQVIDGFSWKANKHDVKFGFEFHRTAIQQVFSRSFRGKLEFEGGGLNPIFHSAAGFSGRLRRWRLGICRRCAKTYV